MASQPVPGIIRDSLLILEKTGHPSCRIDHHHATGTQMGLGFADRLHVALRRRQRIGKNKQILQFADDAQDPVGHDTYIGPDLQHGLRNEQPLDATIGMVGDHNHRALARHGVHTRGLHVDRQIVDHAIAELIRIDALHPRVLVGGADIVDADNPV